MQSLYDTQYEKPQAVIVTITDPGLGLNKQWVRITEITENDDGSLSVIAEEYLAGTGSGALYGYQRGQGFASNYNASPGNANQPVILEPTAQLAQNLEAWIAVSGGKLWEAWQKYGPGSYIARKFKARMQLQRQDPTVEAILAGFVFSVDVPDRDDHYVNKAISSGGVTITFVPDGASTPIAFNGGSQGSPTTPHIQVTILNAQSGDVVVVSSISLTSCNIQVLNGGTGVARNVNVLVQGY